MNNSYKKYWLILAFALILASTILVIALNNKTFTNTAKDTLATRITIPHNTTTSADLSTRLEGNATGIYYPLYSLSELPQVLAAKQAFPNVPFMVNINPSSGPGTSASTSWASAITQLKNAGAVVTGYVPTAYGTGRSIANVEGMISSYNQFYPNMLDGIMFDEVSGSCSEFSFYQTISNYARSLGYSYIRANPGSSICQTDVPLFNHIAIYESAGLPSESTLASNTYYPQYSKSVVGFGATVHTQSTYDSTWLHMAVKYLKWVYITDQTEPNPYAVFPSYFNQYLTDLSALAGTS
ncbi:MAG TPA: spherulation-specific family 4 protein [Candidatus Nitrosotalea sp.]|nr:spherulation-specific family 4 protein [Candidatus Nitrosotalea sp.]